MKPLFRTVAVAAVSCALILPLSACGDGAPSSNGSSGNKATSSSQETPASAEETARTKARQKLGGRIAAMTPAEIEATLTAMTFDGEPLVAQKSYAELTEATRSQAETMQKALDEMEVAPAECLDRARSTDPISFATDLEYLVSVATKSQSVAVAIQKIDRDISDLVNDLVEFANECPNYQVTFAGGDKNISIVQSAQLPTNPPLAEGVILSYQQQGDDGTQTLNFYTVDTTNGIVVSVQAPGDVSADDLETQARLLLEHLTTR